jgi:hypothetical protein
MRLVGQDFVQVVRRGRVQSYPIDDARTQNGASLMHHDARMLVSESQNLNSLALHFLCLRLYRFSAKHPGVRIFVPFRFVCNMIDCVINGLPVVEAHSHIPIRERVSYSQQPCQSSVVRRFSAVPLHASTERR